MIINRVLGKLSHTHKNIETVSIDWFERDKKVLRKTTSNGEDIGIKVETTLNEGDILYEDDNKIIVLEISPCNLISVEVNTMQQMGKLCFELGNRHLSLSIGENIVKCPFDNPTFEYLQKLGFNAIKIYEKFTDYTECKAHTHTHEHHQHE